MEVALRALRWRAGLSSRRLGPGSPDRSCHYGRTLSEELALSGEAAAGPAVWRSPSQPAEHPGLFSGNPSSDHALESEWLSRKVPYRGCRTRGVPWPLPLTPKCCTQHSCFPGFLRPKLKGRGPLPSTRLQTLQRSWRQMERDSMRSLPRTSGRVLRRQAVKSQHPDSLQSHAEGPSLP